MNNTRIRIIITFSSKLSGSVELAAKQIFDFGSVFCLVPKKLTSCAAQIFLDLD